MRTFPYLCLAPLPYLACHPLPICGGGWCWWVFVGGAETGCSGLPACSFVGCWVVIWWWTVDGGGCVNPPLPPCPIPLPPCPCPQSPSPCYMPCLPLTHLWAGLGHCPCPLTSRFYDLPPLLPPCCLTPFYPFMPCNTNQQPSPLIRSVWVGFGVSTCLANPSPCNPLYPIATLPPTIYPTFTPAWCVGYYFPIPFTTLYSWVGSLVGWTF